MTDPKPIPFYIELRRLYRNAGEVEHELKFGVVGMAHPWRTVFARDESGDPRAVESLTEGDFELMDFRLLVLALKCYQLMMSLIRREGGDSGWWKIPDISQFIHRQFGRNDDATHILRALSRHVQDGLTVQNTFLVADDDAI